MATANGILVPIVQNDRMGKTFTSRYGGSAQIFNASSSYIDIYQAVQDWLDSLPKYLITNYHFIVDRGTSSITVSMTNSSVQPIVIKDFYGPGSITIDFVNWSQATVIAGDNNQFILQDFYTNATINLLQILDCSAKIYITGLHFVAKNTSINNSNGIASDISSFLERGYTGANILDSLSNIFETAATAQSNAITSYTSNLNNLIQQSFIYISNSNVSISNCSFIGQGVIYSVRAQHGYLGIFADEHSNLTVNRLYFSRLYAAILANNYTDVVSYNLAGGVYFGTSSLTTTSSSTQVFNIINCIGKLTNYSHMLCHGNLPCSTESISNQYDTTSYFKTDTNTRLAWNLKSA